MACRVAQHIEMQSWLNMWPHRWPHCWLHRRLPRILHHAEVQRAIVVIQSPVAHATIVKLATCAVATAHAPFVYPRLFESLDFEAYDV